MPLLNTDIRPTSRTVAHTVYFIELMLSFTTTAALGPRTSSCLPSSSLSGTEAPAVLLSLTFASKFPFWRAIKPHLILAGLLAFTSNFRWKYWYLSHIWRLNMKPCEPTVPPDDKGGLSKHGNCAEKKELNNLCRFQRTCAESLTCSFP